MKKLAASELILNEDGSVYHLQLKPENIAETIIFVGDPDRVEKITQHFDTIEFSIQKREFKTVTGYYQNKKLSVISTGIGPDNIDIVLNELDALVNINFETKTPHKDFKSLNIIRIGTSGALQKEIDIDSFLVSSHAIGTDNMLRYYDSYGITDTDLENEFVTQTGWNLDKGKPYAVAAGSDLCNLFSEHFEQIGCTVTAPGFYAPQGRSIRLANESENLLETYQSFAYNDLKLTNLEMETAAIYGLSQLLGHQAISLNAILANRYKGAFSQNPEIVIENLILKTLQILASC